MFRLLLAASRYRIGAMLALAALAMFTVAAAVAVPFYTTAAEDYTVRTVFERSAPADRAIAVTADVPTPLGTDVAIEKLLGDVVKRAPQPEFQAITGAYVQGTAGSLDVRLVVRPGFCEALPITGRCPQRAGEVVAGDATAKRLGDVFQYRLPRVDDPITLRVVGTYVPPTDADLQLFWAGRGELTPRPLRAGNPLFTVVQTFDDAKVDSLTATVDLVLPEPVVPGGSVSFPPDAGFDVADGLSRLTASLNQARESLRIGAPLGGLTMLAVSGWILLLAAAHVAGGRRAEAAIGDLRGLPRRHRYLLTRGPALLALILAAPLGVALGWAFVNAMAWYVFDATEPLDLPQSALIAGAAATLAAVAGVSIVESRREGPLLEAFRWVPPPLRRSGLVAELSVVALAVVASVQALTGGPASVVAQVAPLLAAAAIGLLTARLVRPIAKSVGLSRLQRGSLAPGLTALQLARRPGALPAVVLVVVCLALTAHAFGAWERTTTAANERAQAELGAPRVVTVAAQSRPALLAAVHAADPEGAWAVAAAQERLRNGRMLVALDTSRLSTVLGAPDVTGMLRPASNESLAVNGGELVLDVEMTEATGELPITVALSGPKGTLVTAVVTIAPEAGRRDHRVAVPECAVAPGCRLAWLSFFRKPDEFRLHGLRQANPDRELATGARVSAPARWRPSFEMEPEVNIITGDGFVALKYEPDPRRISRDIRMQVADAPVPLPVAVQGEPELVQNGRLATASLFAAVGRPVSVVHSGPGLPGVPTGGVMADLMYADRLSDTFDNDAQLQVWLGERAPGDAVARLEAAGLVPMRTDSVRERAGRYLSGGDALGLRLQLAAAVLAVVLSVFAILVLAGTDRRRRAGELADLLDQGVEPRVIRRVARSGYVVVLAALPSAVLACLAVWALSGARPVLVPVAAATLVLLGSAIVREVFA